MPAKSAKAGKIAQEPQPAAACYFSRNSLLHYDVAGSSRAYVQTL